MNLLSRQGIAGGTAVLFAARVSVAGLGFIQYLLMAYFFGISASTDAYIVAHSVPILFGGIAEAVLNYTFLPVFIEYRDTRGKEEALIISNTIFFSSTLVLLLLTVLVFTLAPLIVTVLAPGFTGEARQIASRLLMTMTPLILLRFLCAFLAALFHSQSKFLLPALTMVLPIIGGIVMLVLAAETMGIAAIPVGYVIGTAIQFLVLFAALSKCDMRIGKEVAFRHPGVRQVARLFGPRLLDFSLNGLNLIIDRWFASFLGAGFISGLTFAQKILRIPNSMVMGSIGKTMMPVLASQRSAGRQDDTRRLISKSLRLVAFATLPVTIFIVLFRVELIRLVFQRGAFDAESTSITAVALLFYSFGIVAYCISPILKVSFFSIQDTLTPLKISAALVAANVVLDYSLMQVLGHAGIALSTSLVMSLGAVALWILLQKRIGPLAGREIASSLGRVLLAALLIGFGLRALYSSVPLAGEGQLGSIIKMMLVVAVGAALFLGASLLLKVPALLEIRALIGRRRGKAGGGDSE